MTKLFYSLTLCLLLSINSYAQQQLASLTVNGKPFNEAGTFYFSDYGNTKDAYVKAEPFARALGLELTVNGDELVFAQGDLTLNLRSTSDVESGLVKQNGVLQANGKLLDSPKSIRSGGNYFVAVSPIVEALGGSSDFDYDNNTLNVVAEPRSAAPLAAPQPHLITEPRIGYQEDGSTRIVVDLPPGTPYSVALADNTLVIKLPGLSAAAFKRTLADDTNLQTVQYGSVAGSFALLIEAKYTLSAAGAGYRLGLLPASDSNPLERLYIDFAANLQGKALEELPSLEVDDIAAAHAPQTSRKIVVIDAGHGGNDSGAASAYAREEDVVLAVALKLRDLLRAQGIDVLMTRDDDYFLELTERDDFATPEINMFISIHANSAADANAHGIETWVFGEPIEDSTVSLAIKENGGGAEGEARTQEAINFASSVAGQIMQAEQLRYSMDLAQTVQEHLIERTGARDRGVKSEWFWVIRKARTAAILVELGFVTNPDEGSKLASAAYQAELAGALADGVIDFISQGGVVANRP